MPRTQLANHETAILSRVLEPGKPTLSPEAARSILELEFPEEDRRRMRELAAKARKGTVSAPEKQEIDDYGRISSLMSILQSKARLSLKKRRNRNGR